MIKQKLNYLKAQMWVKLFMIAGDHVFPLTVVWRETPDKDFSVAHFAWSQRDLNCAVRDYVDELDKGGTPLTTKAQADSYQAASDQ